MKVLVTGVGGQLGYDATNGPASRRTEGIGVDVEEMDITDEKACETVISDVKPDVVIHCAAYIVVDAAEGNLEPCRRVNAEGTRNIAKVCKALDIKMMYISTDYVSSGGGERSQESDDYREPLNVYGPTKYEGEISVEQNVPKYFIMRIAWVFGVNSRSFIKTMLRLGKEKGMVSVVDDQVGFPTYTYDLARPLMDMIQTNCYGRYHATSEGMCSRYEFICEIFRQVGMDRAKVTPVDSSGFPARAKHPQNSRMSKEKLTENGFDRLSVWQDTLGRYLETLKENGMTQYHNLHKTVPGEYDSSQKRDREELGISG